MSNKKIEKVFEYFTNGNTDEAAKVLREYILETAAEINQRLADQEEVVEYMDRDEGVNLSHEIGSDLNDIQSEEMYDDSDLDGEMCEEEGEDHDMSAEDAEDDLVLDLSDEDGEMAHDEAGEEEVHAEIADKVDHIEDVVDHIADGFDELKAEFDKIMSDEHMDMDSAEGEEPVAVHDHEESEDGIEESIELHAVKANNKDMTAKAMSAVGKPKAKIELGGSPVTISKKDSAKSTEGTKVKQMPGGNTVKDAEAALIKESVEDNSGIKAIKDKMVRDSKKR